MRAAAKNGGRSLARLALLVSAAILAFAPVRAADCNANGVPDAEEVAAKGTDCNWNGIPDDCDLLPQSVTLEFGSDYPTGTRPRLPVTGDLDGDGAMDLVLSNNESDNISIFLNQGGGAFAPRVDRTTGRYPGQVVLTDLDRDGDLDLLVPNYGSGFLSFFKNQGAGSLGDEVRLEWIGSLLTLLALDLDGDGDLDLAGAQARYSVWTLYNLGSDLFGEAKRFFSGDSQDGTPGFAALDLDGDGDLDLARANGGLSNFVAVLSNDGKGQFKFDGKFFRVGADPLSLVSGDLDGDQRIDLVSINRGGISVLFHDGSTGFHPAVTYPPGQPQAPVSLELVFGTLLDLNRDGARDVIATSFGTDPSRDHLFLFRNRGDGRLRDPLAFDAGPMELGAAGADFDGDHGLELAVASAVQDRVSILKVLPAPESRDCDGDRVPDECEPDCDGDGVPNRCEVQAGAPDCNGNGLPDSCEEDCNGNGLPDGCDIVAGTSEDCNRNGIPDSCDLAPLPAFVSRDELFVGGEPRTLKAGDLDGDGEPDLALIDAQRNEAVILLHQEARRFAVPRRLGVNGAQSISALSDLDGDSSLDLIASERFEKKVFLFMNRGDGAFLAPVEIASGEGLDAVAADMDSDGATDLVVTGNLKVYWNSGKGQFVETTQVGGSDSEIAVGELDGDRRPDIFIADYWFRGLEQRRFAPAQQLINLFGRLLALADLDGDGDTDVIKSPAFQDETWVLFNEGGGKLGSSTRYDGTAPPLATATVDIDGDGDLDLALGFRILINDGKGAFSPGGSYGTWTGWLAAGDLDGDGRPDLAMTSFSQTVEILWNQAEGGFQSIREYAVPVQSPERVTAADFDGDGHSDLALSSGFGISLLRNNGDATFASWVDFRNLVGPCAVADLDGDEKPDLLSTSPYLSVLLNQGNGRFSLPEVVHDLTDVKGVAAGDLDGDGDPDLAAVVVDDLLLLRNAGQATFLPPARLRSGGFGGPLAILDVDGDSDLDLAAGFYDRVSGAGILTFRNQGDGTLAGAAVAASDIGVQSLIAADLNGDPFQDLVVFPDFGVRIFTGGPEGLAYQAAPPVGQGSFSGCAVDIDGDGDVDLALAGTGQAKAIILPNQGDGTFGPSILIGVGYDPRGIAAGDFDGDRDPDLAVALGSSSRVAILQNALGSAPRDGDHNGTPDECQPRTRFHRGDATHDGKLDISDGISVLQFLMLDGAPPACLDSADVNNDAKLDITDGIFMLDYLFLGTEPPPEPGPPPLPCGTDPDPLGSTGDLGCARYDHC